PSAPVPSRPRGSTAPPPSPRNGSRAANRTPHQENQEIRKTAARDAPCSHWPATHPAIGAHRACLFRGCSLVTSISRNEHRLAHALQRVLDAEPNQARPDFVKADFPTPHHLGDCP